MKHQEEYEVVVIGGGPAGATAAALLAEKGRRVVVFEKERFPRYKVGESLMPLCYFPLDRLGLIDRMKASAYPRKHSVQFVRTDGKISQPFYFSQHMEHEAATTWQVVRSEFDEMLLDTAREKGAQVYENTPVEELVWHHERVVGVRTGGDHGGSREYRAAVTIDASGRDALSMRHNDWRMPDPTLKKIAIWTYFKGAKRDPGLDEGATTIAYLPEKGWFWYIPLPEDMVGVGVVGEREYLYRGEREPGAIFRREIDMNPWIRDHLSTGSQAGEYRVTGDYSYRSKYCAADGLVLVGDAFAFLDPVFSSGVFLALKSGELAADAVDSALADGDVSAGRFEDYGRTLHQGMESMRKLVYAFYDPQFSFGKVFRDNKDLRGDLTDCLIGDLFHDYDALFATVARFAALPKPLEYGRPLVKCPT